MPPSPSSCRILYGPMCEPSALACAANAVRRWASLVAMMEVGSEGLFMGLDYPAASPRMDFLIIPRPSVAVKLFMRQASRYSATRCISILKNWPWQRHKQREDARRARLLDALRRSVAECIFRLADSGTIRMRGRGRATGRGGVLRWGGGGWETS